MTCRIFFDVYEKLSHRGIHVYNDQIIYNKYVNKILLKSKTLFWDSINFFNTR